MQRICKYRWLLVLTMFLGLASLLKPVLAHEGHSHGATSAPPSRSESAPQRSSSTRSPRAPQEGGTSAIARSPPHDGQVSSLKLQHVEVVYEPQGIRVYLYDARGTPLSAEKVAGNVALQVRSTAQEARIPLQYVAAAPGGLDFLATAIDLSNIQDGDMLATFDLRNLPFVDESQVRISQVFALSKGTISVTQFPLSEADREAVLQQELCPVTQTAFDHGPPIKLLVGGKAMYVCCDGCIGDVKKNPEQYYRTLPSTVPAQAAVPQPPQIAVTSATVSDQVAVHLQRFCPVMRQLLGSHGTPLRVSVNGEELYVCCKGCVSKVEVAPAGYVSEAARLREYHR